MITLDEITFDKGLDKIIEYLEQENNEKGFLHDVCEIICGEKTDSRPEVPYLWVIEEDFNPYKEWDTLNDEFVNSPITVYAVCFEVDDLEKSYKDSKNLVARAGASIEKGHNNDSNPFFKDIFFNNFSPRGVEIEGAANIVHQSSIQYYCILEKDNLYGKSREELGFDKFRIKGRVNYEKRIQKRKQRKIEG